MGDPWDEEGFGGDDEWEGGESLAEAGKDEPELDDLEALDQLEDDELEEGELDDDDPEG